MPALARMVDQLQQGRELCQQKMLKRNVTHTDYKEVKNMMTGAIVKIPVDTPMSCDPSTETYWSM